MRRARTLACEYYELTGKPLGVTGEVAELEAAEKLGLTLAGARTPFYDATRETGSGIERLQIKGRAVNNVDRYRGRVPSIKCDGDFDAVLLVLLDRETFEAVEILEAPRDEVARLLAEPGSRSRNERNSMGIRQFKRIARPIWSRVEAAQ